jgi:hypothetical protein
MGVSMVLQADFLKLLYDKMMELHVEHVDGPEEWRYPLPSFKVRARMQRRPPSAPPARLTVCDIYIRGMLMSHT